MKKFIAPIMLAGMVLSSQANASLNITEYTGARNTLSSRMNHDDAHSPAVYTSNKTYLELLQQAAASTLNLENYDFYMAVVNTFSRRASGETLKFNSGQYHQFIALCDRVNAYKFTGNVSMTAEARKTFRTVQEATDYDLDYAIATVRREAYTAKENGK